MSEYHSKSDTGRSDRKQDTTRILTQESQPPYHSCPLCGMLVRLVLFALSFGPVLP